ncbi:MAG: tRNA (guanosine(46)-N7)-methyltransferase TrmB [Amoebophilaceae bacterium]|nr:tRNA (guanosine(46)-N7)-methyltransferase TrmB [Amoebophilaceae bacterium]
MENNLLHREIKSFVLRQGKITPGQQRALEELMPRYGVDYAPELIDLNKVFGRDNAKILEIGFGMGHATWQIAKTNPEQDYLGVEVHLPGVGALLMQIAEHEVNNLRLIRHDAVEVLRHMLADNSLDGVHIFFPDPWHKKRHNKRRLIQTEFVNLLCQKLKPGAYLHLATDWQDYALWMINVLKDVPMLRNQAVDGDYVARPDYRPLTKFEQRGLKLGHGVWDIIYRKISD